MKKKKMRKYWMIFAISGLLLTGFGLSLTGEAIISKMHFPDRITWIVLGTLALTVFNAGLCLFGRAVIIRSKMK
jgi:hypothetical protein